jgi:hypothetical protein
LQKTAMMKIKEINPSEYFTGMDRDGWLSYPNMFHCPKCDYGIYFNQESLRKGRTSNQDKPLKLNLVIALFLSSKIQKIISNQRERFVLDFYCPKCNLPYVIGFEEKEFHMSHYRYRPIAVLSIE